MRSTRHGSGPRSPLAALVAAAIATASVAWSSAGAAEPVAQLDVDPDDDLDLFSPDGPPDLTPGARAKAAPAPAAPAAPAAAPAQAARPLEGMTVRGTIRSLRYAPSGRMDGAVLDDGTDVRLPERAAAQVSNLLREGQPVVVSGFGGPTPTGRSLAATAIGAPSGWMRVVGQPAPDTP